MKIKYLAAVLISLAGLGLTQRADAVILEMTYNNGSNQSSHVPFGHRYPRDTEWWPGRSRRVDDESVGQHDAWTARHFYS